MATNFNPDQQCEGKECQSITDVTYYVEEKKRLCDDCASKEGCIARVKRGVPNIYCEEHDEKVKHTTDDTSLVYVAVDRDGMIIAAELGQSRIYVINPADSKIVNTITCKQDVWMRGVLSSGHIIAQPNPCDERVLIIDRQGGQREIPHSDVICDVSVDPITDDLYVVTSDDEFKTCMIDQVMSGSEVKKRRVTSFPLSIRMTDEDDRLDCILLSRVMISSSGKIITCDGDSILVFEKRISL